MVHASRTAETWKCRPHRKIEWAEESLNLRRRLVQALPPASSLTAEPLALCQRVPLFNAPTAATRRRTPEQEFLTPRCLWGSILVCMDPLVTRPTWNLAEVNPTCTSRQRRQILLSWMTHRLCCRKLHYPPQFPSQVSFQAASSASVLLHRGQFPGMAAAVNLAPPSSGQAQIEGRCCCIRGSSFARTCQCKQVLSQVQCTGACGEGGLTLAGRTSLALPHRGAAARRASHGVPVYVAGAFVCFEGVQAFSSAGGVP